ncbi:MAG: UvrD-helicase domain-containing protein [Acidiferrobacterales bacterium]
MVSHATARHANVAVRAAAGTGKTWLLTSRVISLLLQGVAPGSVLAITFTRKAARDIYRRVTERLLALVTADDTELRDQLTSLGISATDTHLHAARNLFESLLSSEHELRTTTFHAFCQDVLRRFPLEAQIGPGFELVESTLELERAAWGALEQEATASPGGQLSRAVDILLQRCGGIANTRQALSEFLKHRSDWWAYTEGEHDAVAAAESRLLQMLKIVPQNNPAASIREDVALANALVRYVELLGQYPTTANQRRLNQLVRARDPTTPAEEALGLVVGVFLTRKTRPRQLTRSKPLAAALGANAVNELFDLHDYIVLQLQQLHEQQLRLHTFKVTCAWYRCGQRLLEHYQRLKAERNLLDFTDLEWKTCRLLNNSQHAEWIQYKLDQRIDHLLVDEFQDTNPTQWHLLLPLLVEMAAGKTQRQRSVFLVGDEKQSIYRFRRADPDLFNTAQGWLTSHMQATTLTQDRSWRSSPAIIEFVNLIFADPRGQPGKTNGQQTNFMLTNFRVHQTHHQQRWGRVELLPLVRRTQPTHDAPSPHLRNPLQHPRRVVEDERYRAEGRLVAEKITQLIGHPIDDGGVRVLEYGDIMILLRDRTHAPAYEAALRHAAIPYIGAGRGTFIECLEIQDLIHLLQSLIAPYDNLALASTLRCPIFACRDSDLSLLAKTHNSASWRERLASVAQQLASDHPLARGHRMIERWANTTDRIPIHDLLDKIYSEGNVIARYVSAAPQHLKNRVEINLRRLLELALEVDHGRYPSVARFLAHLPILANEERYALAETFGDDRGHVRLMTIHAAKGLEKPVVFLVDTMRDTTGHRASAVRALVDWPVEAARPRDFRLVGKQEDLDSTSRQLVRKSKLATLREEASLLYVALTRAKHVLFVSACEPGRGADGGWYGFIDGRIRQAVAQSKRMIPGLIMRERCAGIVLEQGTVPALRASRGAINTPASPPIDPALAQPLAAEGDADIAYPSRAATRHDRDDNDDMLDDADTIVNWRTRGTVIHRMLAVITEESDRSVAAKRLAQEMLGGLSANLFDAYWREACGVVDEPAFKAFFDPSYFQEARNELPILYRRAGKAVYGLIDRLVIYNNEIAVIDYKTHTEAVCENIEQLAHQFEEQMRLYAAGIKKVYPSKELNVLLLFTSPRAVVNVTEAVSR